MKKSNPIHYLVNKEGHVQAVQISSELWDQVEKYVLAKAKAFLEDDDPFSKEQPLAALEELKSYWDFTYPYEPSLHCEACSASTNDWENDPKHPFHLTNANIGGLLVFQCRCGATVRKKHFHKKVAIECTPKDLSC